MALATTQKGNLSISEYLAKMKSFVDDMASAGKALEEEELVSYILTGLDFDYNLKNIYLMLFASSLLVMVLSPTGVTVGGPVLLVGRIGPNELLHAKKSWLRRCVRWKRG
jgi:hypothetical protein